MTRKDQRPSREPQYIPLDDPSFVFTLYDLNCAAALVCSGFELLSVGRDNPRKCLFIFRKQDGIEELCDLYWSDRLEIKARAYADTIKALKNKLYSE
ncbi:hypothetical protein FBR07_02605 [Candidatus Uhrbacteria bacterium UHB]|nr:hypothetical protein [Candidatus Uhrbacteria bacterium UHB]RIL00165.1 MAG: hypothetical protein DCC77_04755 [Candidatus Uhrbacteria bacterium]